MTSPGRSVTSSPSHVCTGSEGSSEFLPGNERVGLLQRRRVELEQRGDVVPMSHRHQLVLDPLAVIALVATTTIHLHTGQRSEVRGG